MLARLIVAASLLPLLAACEIPPDLVTRSEPPSAEGQPYPNLASVPPNPRRGQPTATAAQLQALEADRQASREADEKLRAAAIPESPPAPVRLPAIGPRGVSSIAPPQVTEAAQGGSVLSLEFPAGSNRVTDAQRQQIRGSSGAFGRSDSRVRVVGVWTRETDRPAARARAQAVAGEIIRQGVPAARVDIRDALMAGQGGQPGRSVEIFVDY
jgi:outer membrane protein OmpA-like peptidoglycan-associated protein